jgi:peroxiredoxin
MRSDIVPGAVFPDYELPDHTAKRRKLSELQGQHPMVLVLSRGGFCPKDRRQAEGLVAGLGLASPSVTPPSDCTQCDIARRQNHADHSAWDVQYSSCAASVTSACAQGESLTPCQLPAVAINAPPAGSVKSEGT